MKLQEVQLYEKSKETSITTDFDIQPEEQHDNVDYIKNLIKMFQLLSTENKQEAIRFAERLKAQSF